MDGIVIGSFVLWCQANFPSAV